MTLKIFKAGNSLAVTVPQELAMRLQLRVGDRVVPELDEAKISYAPVKKTTATVSPKFRKWLTSFEKRYDRALSELARR